MANCFSCGAAFNYDSTAVIGRSDTCDECRADVRCCKNCRHYDRTAYNECKEPQGERVVEKERSNFCDYFSLGGTGAAADDSNEKAAALKKLDDLFK